MSLERQWELEDVFSAEACRTPSHRLEGKKNLLFGLSLFLGLAGLFCLVLGLLSLTYV